MKTIYHQATLIIVLFASTLAIADNGSYSNPYGRDYGLAHTHGYLIQKRAAGSPYTSGSNRTDDPNPVLRPTGMRGSPISDQEARLRALGSDDKTGSADRGWIRQETNRVDKNRASNPNLIYGNTGHATANTVRNPPWNNPSQNTNRYSTGQIYRQPWHSASNRH